MRPALSLHRLSPQGSSPAGAASSGSWAGVSAPGGDRHSPQALAQPLSLSGAGGVFECVEIKPEMRTLWREARELVSQTQETVVLLMVRTINPRAAPVLQGWRVFCERRSGLDTSEDERQG